jgi:uncharacterized repeat protein (TIGR01451 family)
MFQQSHSLPQSKSRSYSHWPLLLLLLTSAQLLLTRSPVRADTPIPGTVIENQASGSFVDADSGLEGMVDSNIVQVSVAEVAGIMITANNTPSNTIAGNTVNFEFTITNTGNDPTQFFIPSTANITGNATQQGNLKIIAHNANGATPTVLTTPVEVTLAGPTGDNALLGTNGIMQPGGSVTVQIPVTINANAQTSDRITVQLGDTPENTTSTSDPKTRLQNQIYIAGSNNVYTVDNADGLTAAEAAGLPVNGDNLDRRQEASAVSAVTVGANTTGIVWDDVNYNGVREPGELGMSGITVNLRDPNNTIVDTTVSNQTGNYVFANPPTGNHYIEFQAPNNYVFSRPDQGNDDTHDSDAAVFDGRTIVTASPNGEPGKTWNAGLTKDTEGDRIPDVLEGTGDRDNDGITNEQDIDPAGFFYDETTGKIIPGGQVTVTGPGAINLINNGTSGMYNFTVKKAGVYTMTVTPPPGYVLSPTCTLTSSPPFDPTGGPDPTLLGPGESGTTGFLDSNTCTTSYLSFDLAVNDPFVINNNIALKPILIPPPPPEPNYCKSAYNEVYAVTQPAGTTGDFYGIHATTGAATKFTSAPASFGITAINTAATDHVNKMVYYGDANKIYAWDVINDQHITVTANFQSLLTAAGYPGKFVTLSSGGAAFYGGALYVGVDGNVNLGIAPTNFNQDFEIFRVNLSADGKTAVSVTPLGIKANSGGVFTTNTMDDWGDFIISDTGNILALTTNRVTRNSTTYQRRFWSFALNSNTFSLVGNTTENAQLAKSGDGKLWGLRSASVVQFDNSGNVIGGPVATTVQAFDGAECVVGSATIGDRVWVDTNGDGIQDPGEAGIPNVTVAIYRDRDKDGVIDATDPKLATQLTDANGKYNFTELLPHDRATGVGHNDFIVVVESGVPGGYVATTPPQQNIDLGSAIATNQNANFGYRLVPKNPNVLLVKRITAVNSLTMTKNGDSLARYIDQVSNPYDDNVLDNPTAPAKPDTDKWVDADGDGNPDLIGGINGGNVQPGDTIEYTIYFLSAGDATAKSVLFCDRVPTNVTFIPTAFNSATPATGGLGSDRGILSLINGTTAAFTNIADGDMARYFPPNSDPTAIYPNLNCGGANTNGAVVINLGDLPNATAPGTPTGAFGFVRFQGRVK